MKNDLGFELPPMRKCARVFFSTRGVVIAALHRDIRGMSPYGAPVAKFEASNDPESLGAAVVHALESARDKLSVADFEQEMSSVLSALGEVDWNSAERRWGLIVAWFEDNDRHVVLSSTKRVGRGGYENVGESIAIESSNERELGEAILNMMTVCKTR